MILKPTLCTAKTDNVSVVLASLYGIIFTLALISCTSVPSPDNAYYEDVWRTYFEFEKEIKEVNYSHRALSQGAGEKLTDFFERNKKHGGLPSYILISELAKLTKGELPLDYEEVSRMRKEKGKATIPKDEMIEKAFYGLMIGFTGVVQDEMQGHGCNADWNSIAEEVYADSNLSPGVTRTSS